VYLVPAFSGLGLPHWAPTARAAIVGLSAHSDRRHVARAGLESMAYQLRDALDAMQAEGGVTLKALRADGGPTANNLLMQFTADVIESEIAVSEAPDCSALGATFMGLLGTGVYDSLESIADLELGDRLFEPKMPSSAVQELNAGWQRAVRQVITGAADPSSEEESQ
jgi:glycerol kinase